MKYISKIFTFVMIGAMTLVGCSQNSEGGSSATTSKKDSPSAVVEKYIKYMQKGNFKDAVMLIKDADTYTAEEVEQMAGLFQALYADKKGVSSYEIVSETIAEDGQSATVLLNIKYGDGTSKDNDKNKVVLTDKGWRMTM